MPLFNFEDIPVSHLTLSSTQHFADILNIRACVWCIYETTLQHTVSIVLHTVCLVGLPVVRWSQNLFDVIWSDAEDGDPLLCPPVYLIVETTIDPIHSVATHLYDCFKINAQKTKQYYRKPVVLNRSFQANIHSHR